MSKTGTIVLWVIIAVIVVGGVWWWVASQGGAPETNNVPTGTTGATTSTSNPQGNSDQSINQSMTSLDAQMNGLNSDSANVNQSLNDQPVSQAQ